MISAYKPKFASPFPAAEPVPFPFVPLDALPLGGLSEELFPPSDLWAVGEGAFLANFSASFFVSAGDLCARPSLALGFGVLFSSGVGFAVGLALGFEVALGVDFGVGFGVGFGVAETVGFDDGVGFGVGFGVIKFDGGVGVTCTDGFGVGVSLAISGVGSGVVGGGVGATDGNGERLGSGSGAKFSFSSAALSGLIPPSAPSLVGLPEANDPGFIQTTFSSFLCAGKIARSSTAPNTSK
jgi:hypothetical protein